MKPETFQIIQQETLVNDFLHITVDKTLGVPGQYVLIENQPHYLMGKSDLLIPTPLSQILKNNTTIDLSPTQGTPSDKPSKDQFTLLIIDNALSAGIFYLKKYRHDFKGLVLIGSDQDYPFLPCPSRMLIHGIPNEVIAALPLLEDWEIPHRLASMKDIPGCFQGTVHALAEHWVGQNQQLVIQKMVLPQL